MAITEAGKQEIPKPDAVRVLPVNKPAQVRINLETKEEPVTNAVPRIILSGLVSGATAATISRFLRR